MKTLAVFLLFICFLLLTGYHHVHNEPRLSNTSYLNSQQIKKSEQVKAAVAHVGSLKVDHKKLSVKTEELSIDDGGEDEDLSFVRKYVLLIRYFITLASLSLLRFFYNSVKNQLPFCFHFSYSFSSIYILQRVLRI